MGIIYDSLWNRKIYNRFLRNDYRGGDRFYVNIEFISIFIILFGIVMFAFNKKKA